MAWIRKYWSIDKPKCPTRFIGRMVRVKDDRGEPKVVEIEKIMGSLAHPTRFQIDSKGASYLISMLDLYAQMNNETISEEDIKDFEAAFDGSYAEKKPLIPLFRRPGM